jgi:hypothetical protein
VTRFAYGLADGAALPAPLAARALVTEELAFTLGQLRRARHNESAWVYAQSLAALPAFASFRRLAAFAADVASESVCVLALATLVRVLSLERCPPMHDLRSGAAAEAPGNAWWGAAEPATDPAPELSAAAHRSGTRANLAAAAEHAASLCTLDGVRCKYWAYRREQLQRLLQAVDKQ